MSWTSSDSLYSNEKGRDDAVWSSDVLSAVSYLRVYVTVFSLCNSIDW